MKLNIDKIKQSKNKEKLTMITAYDALFAKLFDAQADMILVGDSLNMSFGGQDDTLGITLDQMIYHTNAVCKGAPNTFVILDMPFGTYNNPDQALDNAVKVYKETRADAVKIEGGEDRAHIIKHLTQNSIAVIGHVGLMPQFVRSEGGYKVRGKDMDDEEQLLRDIRAVEEAGAFAVVIEGVKSEVAAKLSQAVSIPTIGIGAGKDTDGQVLVWSDMFGFFEAFKPKFVRQYVSGAELIKEGLQEYIEDVKNGRFPAEAESY
jgi:3-methyl-2-oxobutanoate hydroxymethyltransferase